MRGGIAVVGYRVALCSGNLQEDTDTQYKGQKARKGLSHQHLTAVRAIAEISDGTLRGGKTRIPGT